MKKITLSLLTVASLYSSQFSINPSFQGYSGVINTPNAQVTKESHAVLHLNNQFDNHLKAYNYDKKDASQEDYILGFGLFSFMEVQGRLSEAPGYHRDLSVNTKLQLPFHHKYLPDIAVGIQDLGGAANHYDNQYIVLDKELYFLRASVGYGSSNNEYHNRVRMDGLFGALEVKAMDWLYLMAEDDSIEQHVGLRVEMPQSWLDSFNLRGTVVQNLTSDEMSFALTLDIPLWHKSKIQKDLYQEERSSQRVVDTQRQEESNSLSTTALLKTTTMKTTKNSIDAEDALEQKLVKFGFENVRVGAKDDTIYIEAENSIFDQNDLDALGYIAGVVATSDLEYKNYTITLLKNSLNVITMSGVSRDFKKYIEEPSFSNEQTLKENLRVVRDFDSSSVVYGKKQNSSLFIPRVELSLGLISAVGTEVGAFDYAASLRANSYMTLYDGVVASVLYEQPLSNSDDFDEGGDFYRRYETNMQSRVVNAMLHQTLHIDNLINTLSVGKYQTDFIGVFNQTDYTTTSGEHALRYKGGYFLEESDTAADPWFFSLASYRYAYAPLDTYLEVTYGTYWYGDIGGEVELKRFFGETSVAFNYKNSSANGINEQFAGIELSFPLTTRKLYRANYIQLKGKKDFTYKLRTTVNKDDGSNAINHNYARTPEHDFEITSHYLNRDRLTTSYIKQHLDRMRDAFVLYYEE